MKWWCELDCSGKTCVFCLLHIGSTLAKASTPIAEEVDSGDVNIKGIVR